jgi:hypothetical protein
MARDARLSILTLKKSTNFIACPALPKPIAVSTLI